MTWPDATSPPTWTNGGEPGDGAEYQMPVSGAVTDGLPDPAEPDPAEPDPDGAAAWQRWSRPGRREARTGDVRWQGFGLAQDEPGAAGLDLELDEVAPLEDRREAVDETEQRGVTSA